MYVGKLELEGDIEFHAQFLYLSCAEDLNLRKK
jgi:hypothetical protein